VQGLVSFHVGSPLPASHLSLIGNDVMIKQKPAMEINITQHRGGGKRRLSPSMQNEKSLYIYLLSTFVSDKKPSWMMNVYIRIFLFGF
jgi:hypothetical protein